MQALAEALEHARALASMVEATTDLSESLFFTFLALVTVRISLPGYISSIHNIVDLSREPVSPCDATV